MNIHDMFPSQYVSAYDLKKRHVTLTIVRVEAEQVERQDKKTKRMESVKVYVVYFLKAKKGLLLNKTNALTIAALYGDESDKWLGKAITLYPTVVNAFGKKTDAVRIEEREPLAPVSGTDEPPDELNREGVPDEPEIDINAAAGLEDEAA